MKTKQLTAIGIKRLRLVVFLGSLIASLLLSASLLVTGKNLLVEDNEVEFSSRGWRR